MSSFGLAFSRVSLSPSRSFRFKFISSQIRRKHITAQDAREISVPIPYGQIAGEIAFHLYIFWSLQTNKHFSFN